MRRFCIILVFVLLLVAVVINHNRDETPAINEEPTIENTTSNRRPTKHVMLEYIPMYAEPEKVVVMYYTEEEVVMLAKLLYRECRGVPSVTEQACVAWTVCNRVDSPKFHESTVADVIRAPGQFAYYYNTPVTDELYELAKDVLSRWNNEKNGETNVGRVLPIDYTYFSGKNGHNNFRNSYSGDYDIWDYRLESPYES